MASADEDIDTLLAKARRAAEIMLTGAESFDPFALALDPAGEIEIINAVLDPAGGDPEKQIAYSRHVLRRMARGGKVKASAVIALLPARHAGPADKASAVVLEIEHRDGVARRLCLPVARDGERWTLGDPIDQPSEPYIFGGPAGQGRKPWWKFW